MFLGKKSRTRNILAISVLNLCFGNAWAAGACENALWQSVCNASSLLSILSGKKEAIFLPGESLVDDLIEQVAFIAEPKAFGTLGTRNNQFETGLLVESVVPADAERWKALGLLNQDSVVVPRIHFSMSPANGIRLGTAIFTNPRAGISAYSLTASADIYELGAGSTVLMTRGSYTLLRGVENLAFRTASLDLLTVHQFGRANVHLGMGTSRAQARYDLNGVNITSRPGFNKVFGGVSYAVAPFALALEYQKSSAGKATSLNATLTW